MGASGEPWTCLTDMDGTTVVKPELGVRAVSVGEEGSCTGKVLLRGPCCNMQAQIPSQRRPWFSPQWQCHTGLASSSGPTLQCSPLSSLLGWTSTCPGPLSLGLLEQYTATLRKVWFLKSLRGKADSYPGSGASWGSCHFEQNETSSSVSHYLTARWNVCAAGIHGE